MGDEWVNGRWHEGTLGRWDNRMLAGTWASGNEAMGQWGALTN
jgi:hypothetical protein